MKLTKSEIEHIIEDEIVVDCYSDDEVAMGWEVFMTDNISYPFKAEYFLKKRNGNKVLHRVKIVGNHNNGNDLTGDDYFFDAELEDMIITIELRELINIQADKNTQKTLQVWKSRSEY